MAAKNRFNPIDCLGAALPDEEYWLLLARDPAMPAMLGIWASLRVGNLKAASENFMLLMAPDLVRHYQNHPDIAKSEETIETANRAAEWRERNLTAGPNGTPSWKQSLVRPKMLDLEALELPEVEAGQPIPMIMNGELQSGCEAGIDFVDLSVAEDAAYLREKGRQLGYDQGGDKLIEIADRLWPEETHGDMS